MALVNPRHSPSPSNHRALSQTECFSGDMDAYYFGTLMRKHPEILAVCDQMLPADVQRENTGVGG